MIGILLLTHEDFGSAMIKSSNLIVGEAKKLAAVGLNRGDDILDFRTRVKNKMIELDDGNGVLVFVDLFGASPYNTTAIISKDCEVEYKCISGLSFPMLLEALMMRDIHELFTLADICMQAGKNGIKELFTEMKNA